MTPLDWRLLEAVGEPLPTQSLPIAFAHAELRDTAGWKAQIEAAERLSRAGALDPNLLVGLYTARKAAASGGVWDRVRAFQALDEALTAKDAAAVARTLPVAYDRMSEVELEVTLSRLVADRLDGMTLPAEAEALAFRMGLLSMEAEAVAKAHKPRDAAERFLVALAAGDPAKADPADPMGRAIAAGFGKAAPSEAVKELLAQDRPGEALLLALEEVARGMDGDTTGVTQGLALSANWVCRRSRAAPRSNSCCWSDAADGGRGHGALDLGLPRGAGGGARCRAQHAPRLRPRPEGLRNLARAPF